MTTQTDTLRKALEVARQYVKLQNRAEGIFEGFGGRKPRPSDADLKMIDEAIASCQQAQEQEPVKLDRERIMELVLDYGIESLRLGSYEARDLKWKASMIRDKREAAYKRLREALYAATPIQTEITSGPSMQLIGEMRDGIVVWFDQNPHAHPIGTKFYAAPARPDEQEKPYGFDDFIREAKEKNLTIHDILPQLVKRCAELEVEQQAPAGEVNNDN